MNMREIGEKLSIAGRLNMEPIAIHVTGKKADRVPMSELDRCVARAIYMVARGEAPSAFVNEEVKGLCPGGWTWLGLGEPHEKLKYFVSYGSPDFRGGQGEFLKRTPDLVERSRDRVGKITFPRGTLVAEPCSMVFEDAQVLSLICFADALGARNLCALAHFGSDEPFGTVMAPWGPMCASLITYPGGLAENAPPAMMIGSMDPTVNSWFPKEYLSIGIPLALAVRMANDLNDSFIIKRPRVAYPER